MSKKNILNTQINHKKLYANQLIPLDEYLYEDFVLLPELNNIGKTGLSVLAEMKNRLENQQLKSHEQSRHRLIWKSGPRKTEMCC